MADGWIKLYWKIKDSAAWENSTTAALWVHILLNASVRGCQLRNGETLAAGDCVISQAKLAEWLGVRRQVLAKMLRGFEEFGMIKVKKANRCGTVVSVCNWGTYQSDGRSRRTTNEQQTNLKRTTTDQEANLKRTTSEHETNLKRAQTESLESRGQSPEARVAASPKNPQPLGGFAEVKAYWEHMRLRGSAKQFLDYNDTRGWAGVKDWRAAARLWSSRQKNFDSEAMAGRVDVDLTIPAKAEAAR